METLGLKSFTRRSLVTRGLTTAVALFGFAAFVSPVSAQVYRYNPEHRRPVEATIQDLEGIAAHTWNDRREHDRYMNAVRHLHEFGDLLHEGGIFDKGKLDRAIGDVQSVIDHNPMPPGARDRLFRDVTELRRLREHFDERYRYTH
jgi:hypothetical protein